MNMQLEKHTASTSRSVDVPVDSAPTGYVYIISSYDADAPDSAPVYFKIGYTRDPMHRLYSLQTATPFELELEAAFPGDKTDEKRLHKLMRESNIKREWFRWTDDFQELFDDLVDARHLLRFEHGEDYEPTISECLAYADTQDKFNRLFFSDHQLMKEVLSLADVHGAGG